MKTQISRNSAQPEKSYSGVYQQQGRMITDADWNELADIDKQRVWDALRDAIKSGAPRAGGLAVVGPGIFQPGVLYVDGIRARLPGTANVTYALQPDLPSPPALPAPPYVLYADVWDRTVTSLEDQALLDPGLHGADTCTRTQTMLQLKWCPDAVDPETSPLNPRRGDAGLKLKVRRVTAASDACDPCSDQVDAGGRVGNYLFRVEVHDVFIGGGGHTIVELKWSRENGAEHYASNNIPDDFDEGDWVFEFFDKDTERTLGVRLGGPAPARGQLVATIPTVKPRALVRRWDGSCRLDVTAGTFVSGTDKGTELKSTLGTDAHGFFQIAAGRFAVNLDLLNLDLQLTGRTFVAGDFWQAPVREEIHVADSVVLGATGAGATPQGVEHHYLRLGRVDGGGALVPLDDAGQRRFHFPPLTDLHAADVGFVDNCSGIFAGAKNVQAALDAICGIGAEDIGYSLPACPAPITVTSLLETLLGTAWPDFDGDGKVSVKDVLDALLCKLDAGRLPYAGTSARWTDIKEGAAAPTTVQGALDDLIQFLDSQDIPHTLGCAAGSNSVRGKLWAGAVPASIGGVVNDLLCNVNASHIPLVPSTCPTIQTSTTVQDAIEELCKRRDGLTCEVTVGVGGEIATLDLALEAFAAQGQHLVICLLPQEHKITKAFSLTGKGTIKINGSGVASPVRVEADKLELSATEIMLRDLNLQFVQRTGHLRAGGGRVVMENCQLAREADGQIPDPAMLQLGDDASDASTTVVLRNNVLSTRVVAVMEGVKESAFAPDVLGVTLQRILERLLTLKPGTPEFATELDKAGQRIAALPLAKRTAWATGAPAGLKDTPFIKGLTAPTPKVTDVKKNLGTLYTKTSAYGRAVQLASPRVGGELVGNEIAGHVVVVTEANATVDLGLASTLTDISSALPPPDSAAVKELSDTRLHLGGNRLVRFTYLANAASLLTGATLKAQVPTFRLLSLTDNEFFFDTHEQSGGAPLVAIGGRISLRGNMMPTSHTKVGPRLIAHHILCSGNSGDSIPVQFLAAVCPKNVAELKVHNFLDFVQFTLV